MKNYILSKKKIIMYFLHALRILQKKMTRLGVFCLNNLNTVTDTEKYKEEKF